MPQRRERVFIVAFRGDIEANWAFPTPAHSQDALFFSQWGTGEYWERHKVAKRKRPAPPANYREKVSRIRETLSGFAPWLTIRDAIADLPDPRKSSGDFLPWGNLGDVLR